MILDTPIRTSRLQLRTLSADDASGCYLKWMNDPTVTYYLESATNMHDIKSISDFIETMNNSEAGLLLGVFISEPMTHIGNIKLGSINHFQKQGDIGLLIGDKSQWGKGYASEAIEGICDYARDTLKLKRVYAGTHLPNTGSRKAFLNAGFSEEGVLKGHGRVGNEWHDAVFMGRNF